MEADGAMLQDGDYAALAEFRFALRQFQAFSSERAAQMGLTPQQHRALLALRAAPAQDATVGYVARRLLLKPRSEEHTSELQSLMRISYAVFCLKKKQNKNQTTNTIIQQTLRIT